MAGSPPEENQLQLFVEQLSTTSSNDTEVAKLATPSSTRPHPAVDNGVRDGRPINWPLPPIPLERLVHRINSTLQPSTHEVATTQGIISVQ